MDIYVIRHGQTDLNVQGRFQGRRGLPLNATGIAQAEACREELKDIAFDTVYSSPQKRALQTAGIAAGVPEADIVTDARIDVFDLGDADGELILPDTVVRYGIIPDPLRFSGVEDTEKFAERVYAFMDEITAKYRGREGSVLISGHKCTTGAIHAYFTAMPEDGDFFSLSSKNGRYKVYKI